MTKQLRCAVYPRKSTEEGLEKEFNSLDAQREACEAYIKSQVGEGWMRIKTAYDDGGFSGGSMDRPALVQLLRDVTEKRVDVVVVYKVDRLTRSLADFAKIVEIFDTHGVSFVSITQSFNTTTSMGRLTLNVLLSFAQFEREVIAERVRDKIAASKAKGMWMGGIPPIGYDLKDKQLIVNSAEAEKVRFIFRRYLELPSVHDLSQDLRDRGMVGKRWLTKNGCQDAKEEWSSGSLLHLLKRKLYIGIVPHKGMDHPGRHEPIVDRKLFDQVQAKIIERGYSAGARRRPNSSGKLVGLIYDDAGNRMSPVRQRKGPKMIRYYVSQATIKRQHQRAGSLPRVRADLLEGFVDEHLQQLRANTSQVALRKVIVEREGFAAETEIRTPEGEARASTHRVVCRLKLRHATTHPEIQAADAAPDGTRLDPQLLLRTARAVRWAALIADGTYASAKEIAAAEGYSAPLVARDLALAWRPARQIEEMIAV